MRSGGKKVKLTLCAWCAFVLQWRKGQDNALMHAGRLTQELAVHFRHSLLLQGNAHTAHMKLGWINYADPLPHSYPHHRCYRCYTFTSLLVYKNLLDIPLFRLQRKSLWGLKGF